jgi:hypothetical protein
LCFIVEKSLLPEWQASTKVKHAVDRKKFLCLIGAQSERFETCSTVKKWKHSNENAPGSGTVSMRVLRAACFDTASTFGWYLDNAYDISIETSNAASGDRIGAWNSADPANRLHTVPLKLCLKRHLIVGIVAAAS